MKKKKTWILQLCDTGVILRIGPVILIESEILKTYFFPKKGILKVLMHHTYMMSNIQINNTHGVPYFSRLDA